MNIPLVWPTLPSSVQAFVGLNVVQLYWTPGRAGAVNLISRHYFDM
jgi:hypothetical protein